MPRYKFAWTNLPQPLLKALARWPLEGLDEPLKLEQLRVIEVALTRHGRPSEETVATEIEALNRQYPAKSFPLNRELSQLLVWLGAHMSLDGTLTPGRLVTTYGFAAFLAWPVQNATVMLQASTRAWVGATKVLEVLRVVPPTGERPATAAAPAPGVPLVDEVSGVRVDPGRLVALVSADPDESAAIATRTSDPSGAARARR